GILPGHQDPDRPGRTPGPPLDLLATLDPDCDARPRPARRLRRHHPDPPTGRADPADLQRDRPTGQPADRRTDPVPGKRPALEPLATPTPTPRPNQPLPPPTSNMITIYGCSTSPTWTARPAPHAGPPVRPRLGPARRGRRPARAPGSPCAPSTRRSGRGNHHRGGRPGTS